MNLKTDLLYAGLSDTGRARRENEDRILTDADSGLFMVADGLGGHAAGERAAETAVEMIAARIGRKIGTPEDRMREAITVANNEIHSQAQSNPEWNGMACVVTVALIEDGQVTVGHVGDSRMYVIEPGAIRKITRDHSPVGELEDSGRLSEAAAMAHPRRNEVYRDLGSEPHGPDDEEFIEVLRFNFRPNSALLLCSDGLTDQVPAEHIRRIVETNARDPRNGAKLLVQAANDAGGKDNVSVVLVVGGDFGPPLAVRVAEPRVPVRKSHSLLTFMLGLVLAAGAFVGVRPYLVETTDSLKLGYGNVRVPLTWKVGKGGFATVTEALSRAREGDTVVVEPGEYHENIVLRSGIALISAQRRAVTLQGGETLILAENVRNARISGFRLVGPAAVGVKILNSDLEVSDLEITGMREAGIEVDADSSGPIRANTISGNPGSGIVVRGAARPLIANNVITGNGKTAGALRPGIYVSGAANPSITGNIIAESGVEQIWASPLFNADTLLTNNAVAPGAKDRRNLVKVVTR